MWLRHEDQVEEKVFSDDDEESPYEATRHKKPVPKIPATIVPPPLHPTAIQIRMQHPPPSRPSTLLPTSIQTSFQPPPTRLNPTKSIQSNPS